MSHRCKQQDVVHLLLTLMPGVALFSPDNYIRCRRRGTDDSQRWSMGLSSSEPYRARAAGREKSKISRRYVGVGWLGMFKR
jgi:hypothetical protein